MAYILPDLKVLLDGMQQIRKQYLQDNATANLARLALLDTLEALAKLINSQKLSSNKITNEELQEIYLGAYFYCIESINQEYRILYPEFSKGYLFNSGSRLYKLFLQELGITAQNQPDNKEKLIYMSKFFNFAFKTHKASIKENMNDFHLDVKAVKQSVKSVIKSHFYYLANEANQVSHAIPTEASLDSKMAAMLNNYLSKTKNDNADRKYLVKLIVTLKDSVHLNLYLDDTPNFLTRSHRIKMGLLLTIMQSIWNSYLWRNPTDNSVLYDLCLDALNIKSMEDIDPQLRIECLSTFKAYVTDYSMIEILENAINAMPDVDENRIDVDKKAKYLDSRINKLRHLAIQTIDTLEEQHSSTYSITQAAKAGALGVALAVAPIGFGGGAALGFFVTQTYPAAIVKLVVDQVTSPAMTFVFNQNGQALGYFATSLVIDETIKSIFSCLSGSAAMLFGAAVGGAGGAITVVITKATYDTFANLCTYCLDLHAKNGSNLAKDVDPRFIDCLLSLPSDVFSKKDKLKIENVMKGVSQGGIFGGYVKVNQNHLNIVDSLQSDDEKIDRGRGYTWSSSGEIS